MNKLRKEGLLLLLLTGVLLCLLPGRALAAGSRAKKTVKAKPTQEIRVSPATEFIKIKGAKPFRLRTKVISGKAYQRGKITFRSKNKKTATVDAGGKVTVHQPGKAEILVKAAGNAFFKTGKVSVFVTVVPNGTQIARVQAVAGKMLLVRIKKGADVSGYELRYSTNSNMKGAQSVRAEGGDVLVKGIRNLQPGKTYYIQVRTYRTVNGMDYFSKWSKSVKGVPVGTKTGY